MMPLILTRSVSSIVLLAVLAPQSALARGSSGGSSIKGVAPGDVHKYTASASSSWTCLDGSQIIPHSAINDDYCDCADGSDEPGTSACPNSSFYCANEGHIPAYVISSRVNDGICDPECCDGSDEDDGKVSCPNVCAKVGKEYRKRKQEEENKRRAGAKIRAGYISDTRKKMSSLEAELASLEVEVQVAREVQERSREELRVAEEADQAVIEQKKSSAIYATIQKHQDAMTALLQREGEVKQELRKLTDLLDDLSTGYNPNYQDMAVKGAVMAYRSWRKGGEDEAEETHAGDVTANENQEASTDEDGTASKDSSAAPVGENNRLNQLLDEGEWSKSTIEAMANQDPLELLDDNMFQNGKRSGSAATRTDDEGVLFHLFEYLPDHVLPIVDGFIDRFLDVLLKTRIISGVTRRRSRLSSPIAGGDSSAEPENVTAARRKLSDAESKVRSLDSSISSTRSQLDLDPKRWGPLGEWKPLDNKCIERNMGEYTYEFCFFGTATQKPNRGSGHNVSLGRFKAFEPTDETLDPLIDEAYFARQKYDRGQRCWNGPERSVIVDLECGTKEELLDVFEAEKCIYSMKVITPALCWAPEAAAAANTQKQEGRGNVDAEVGAKDEL